MISLERYGHYYYIQPGRDDSVASSTGWGTKLFDALPCPGNDVWNRIYGFGPGVYGIADSLAMCFNSLVLATLEESTVSGWGQYGLFDQDVNAASASAATGIDGTFYNFGTCWEYVNYIRAMLGMTAFEWALLGTPGSSASGPMLAHAVVELRQAVGRWIVRTPAGVDWSVCMEPNNWVNPLEAFFFRHATTYLSSPNSYCQFELDYPDDWELVEFTKNNDTMNDMFRDFGDGYRFFRLLWKRYVPPPEAQWPQGFDMPSYHPFVDAIYQPHNLIPRSA